MGFGWHRWLLGGLGLGAGVRRWAGEGWLGAGLGWIDIVRPVGRIRCGIRMGEGLCLRLFRVLKCRVGWMAGCRDLAGTVMGWGGRSAVRRAVV